ncbi:MAG: hypothetical protein [Microviridae sp.]|nr:MAG: hypothetical protein [Microviridae sp.]
MLRGILLCLLGSSRLLVRRAARAPTRLAGAFSGRGPGLGPGGSPGLCVSAPRCLDLMGRTDRFWPLGASCWSLLQASITRDKPALCSVSEGWSGGPACPGPSFFFVRVPFLFCLCVSFIAFGSTIGDPWQ